MKSIKTKKQFYEKYIKGILGNRIKTWETFDDVLKSGHNGLITVRSKNKNNKFCFYDVEIESAIYLLRKNKINLIDCVFSESLDDKKTLLLQGDITIMSGELYLNYSRVKDKMRNVIPLFKTAKGLVADNIIKSIMSPSSYSDIKDLVYRYDNHIIEFGVYNHTIGFSRCQNTVIWEVRKY